MVVAWLLLMLIPSISFSSQQLHNVMKPQTARGSIKGLTFRRVNAPKGLFTDKKLTKRCVNDSYSKNTHT